MRKALVTTCLLLALVLTGCGGGSSDDDGAAAPTTAATPSDVGTFCTLFRTYSERLGGLTAATATTAQVRQLAGELRTAIQQAVQAAPPEIKADAALVASAAVDYLEALQQVGFELSRLPSDAAAKFQGREVIAATSRLLTYSRNTCG